MTQHTELIARLRSFETDHKPEGWPAIQMRDVSALLDAIETLDSESISNAQMVIKLQSEIEAANKSEIERLLRIETKVDALIAERDALRFEVERLKPAVKTLEQLGYSDNGGELWKPPIGKAPDFNLIDSLQAQLAAAQGQSPLIKKALDALEVAQDNLREHGDNCFLHDSGEYASCFCGKDSLSSYLQGVVEELAIAQDAAPIPQQVAEPSVPDGWKLVPIEPTDMMMNCFSGTLWRQLSPSKMTNELKAYEAMLAAAPQPKEPK